MLNKFDNTLIVLSLVLVVNLCLCNANTKRTNNGNNNNKKLNNKVSMHNTNAFEFDKEIENENDAYAYSYSKPRSLSIPQYNTNSASDSCHLSIECKDTRNLQLRLPIYGPRGDQGPPGITGMKGEKGEPGIPGIPARDPPPPNFSAFFAALQNNTGPFKQDKDLIFTTIITNYGDNYDPNTGVYTAPFSGIYQFFITISATGRQKAGVNVMKNRQSILTVWSESEPWSTSSQTVIVRLAANDKVFLRLLSRASHVHGYMYSSFGGSLLYEELNLV